MSVHVGGAGAQDKLSTSAPAVPWFFRSAWRLFLTLSLVLVLLMGSLGYLLYAQARRALESQAARQAAVAARLMRPVVENHFDGLREYVESYARRPSLVALVQKADIEGVRAQLKELLVHNTSFDRAFVSDPRGILWSDYPPVPEVMGMDFSWRDWFKGVNSGRATYVSEVYKRAAPPQRQLVAIATPVLGARRELIGYLAGQHTIDALIYWIASIQPSAGGSLMLIDQNGVPATIRTDGSPPPSLVEHPLIRQALAGTEGSARTADPLTGEQSFISYARIKSLGWIVLSRQPVSVALAPLVEQQRTILVFAVIAFCVLMIPGFFWLNTIRRYSEALLESDAAKDRYLTELTAANKELESFSYSVSHDLRAPLRAIDGFSEELWETYGDRLDPDGQDYVKRVRLAAQRMGQLIDDLLTLSRVTRAELQRVDLDLSALAETIAGELRRSDPERQVQFAIASELRARADPGLLRIVLENLLGNAWKFTAGRHDARIEFGRLQEGGELAYFVRDNGAGFDMAYAAKLFHAFQRLHGMREFPGTGIGLATVQRIVHRHGGKVWAEGTVGRGASFYFRL